MGTTVTPAPRTLADHPALGGRSAGALWGQALGAAFRKAAPAPTPTAAPDAERAPPPPYGEWIARARPEHVWTARHFVEMQRVLDQLTRGERKRAYTQVPIRHGKSEHNTVGYAVYRLEHDPATRILVGSYNQRQANKFSRQIRRLAQARGVAMSPERNAAEEWETQAGGGVRAVGAGAGVASVNADVIIIDDPIGSRDDAESKAKRDQVYDWLTSDILARAEPHTVVLFTMSRWHQDDPGGRIRDQQGARWTVLDLPGEAEPDDPLGRAVGEPLWPELRGAEWLAEKRGELLAYGYASLIQGRPRPRDGGMFKWAWWQLLDATPEPGALVGPLVRYWDLAGTEAKGGSHDPDYTAGPLAGRLVDRRTVWLDVARFRHSVGQRDAALVAQARADVAQYAGRVQWWIEEEAGIAGADRTAALVRQLHAVGCTVHTERPTGSKVTRAEPHASACEAGNVLLAPDDHLPPERRWRDPFRAEHADFPSGTHDDQVDGASGAFNKLAAAAGAVWGVSSYR